MGIYAPERAGDVGGALLVMGADADMMPASSRGGECVCAMWGTTSAIVVIPPRQREDDFEPKVGAVNRRHRPTLVLRTGDAESRGIVLEFLASEIPCEMHGDPSDRTFRCARSKPMRVRPMRAPHAIVASGGGCSTSTGEIRAG
jgi:hypothetical protein